MDNKLYHLLFVDDDKDFLHSMKMAISSKLRDGDNGVDIESHFVNGPKEGMAFAEELAGDREKIAVVVSDQQMPGLTGIEFIEKASKIIPNAIKVLLTGHASLDSAKYAINHQVLDQYVSKPIEDYDSFASLIRNSVRTYHFREEKELAEQEIRQYVRELEQTNARIKSMHLAAERIAYLAQGFKKLDLDEVLDLIITRIPDIFRAKYASLFLFSKETNSLELVRSNYLSGTYSKSFEDDDRSLMMTALRQNSAIILPEIRNTSYDFLQKECLGNSCIIIPFILGADGKHADIPDHPGEIKGVLNMGNITDMENADVVSYTALLIQNILGVNILHARLYQQALQSIREKEKQDRG